MLHELLNMDIRGFNVRNVPQTAALQEQRKLSLPVPESWWMDCLMRGYVFRSKLGLEDIFGKWHEKVATDILYVSYLEFAERHRERHPISRETLGRLMVRMGCKAKRLSESEIGEHVTDVTLSYGVVVRKAKPVMHPRPPGYSIGTLTDARHAFQTATGLSVDWGEDDCQG